jgi:hypothetical protein
MILHQGLADKSFGKIQVVVSSKNCDCNIFFGNPDEHICLEEED